MSSASPPANTKRAIELLAVFLPALAVFIFAESWVGNDPLARQAVIWVAYVLMLSVVYLVRITSYNVCYTKLLRSLDAITSLTESPIIRTLS